MTLGTLKRELRNYGEVCSTRRPIAIILKLTRKLETVYLKFVNRFSHIVDIHMLHR